MKSKSKVKRVRITNEAMEVENDEGKEIIKERFKAARSTAGYRSKCCNFAVQVVGPARDFIGDKNPMIGTCHFVCMKCWKDCNIK